MLADGVLVVFRLVYAISDEHKNDDRVIVVQQPAKYVMLAQQPIIQQTVAPQQRTCQAQPAKTKECGCKKHKIWNWQETGKVRLKHTKKQACMLKQEELGKNILRILPVVQIGKVGDTIYMILL